MPEQVVIVGGGVAAMRCAFELRERGFDGRLTMLSAEFTRRAGAAGAADG
jgi:NADPH-dependent 2,4-dienoyl-CoA reductase/sulfur reductase-like enzyme